MMERVAIADPVFCAKAAAIWGAPLIPDAPVMLLAVAMHAYATADTTTRHRMFANYNAWFREQTRAENQ